MGTIGHKSKDEIAVYSPGGNPRDYPTEDLDPPQREPQNSKAHTASGALLAAGRGMIAEQLRSWIFAARWHYVQLRRVGFESKLRYAATPVRNRFYVPHRGNDRTGYIIGLFGSGRLYLWQCLMQNIGRRARYLRDGIRPQKRPTSMIYVGHATMKYRCRGQAPPSVMSRIKQAVKSRFADLIFVYRHPLDSLLTNWIWWRNYIRRGWMVSGISDVYKNTDHFCLELENCFSEFEDFAQGDSSFFATSIGPPFLSFREFVEETELFTQSATLSLRMEDFATDPLKEFSKLLELMSVDCDLRRLHVPPPTAMTYRFLEVKQKVPQFRNFIAGLDAGTKERIERIGYTL
jgi:hypothetical protein